MFTQGKKVKGNYYGRNFTGTIVANRAYTGDWSLEVVTIQFDSPITMHGENRNMISTKINNHGVINANAGKIELA